MVVGIGLKSRQGRTDASQRGISARWPEGLGAPGHKRDFKVMGSTETCRILLIEDAPCQAHRIAQALRQQFGPTCRIRLTRVAEVDALADDDLQDASVALCDLDASDGRGLAVVAELVRRQPSLPVVVVTADERYEVVIEAIRRGASDYVAKAGDYARALPLVVQKNLELARIKREHGQLQQQLTRTLADLRLRNQQLEEAVSQLHAAARTDVLTGLANRRALNEALDQMFAQSQRYDHDLAAVMIDLDRFKAANDGLGHATGDELLKRAARTLRLNCRSSDVVARFGGDEFVLLLPQTDARTAAGAVARIGEEFLFVSADCYGPDWSAPRVTMSMGVASVRHSRPSHPSQLLAHADAALYQAKQTRRGEVTIFEPTSAESVPSH